jgi:glycosyltransferase involved in cell wall biosynthesis
MSGRTALIVAPYCDETTDSWYSPGREAKLAQVGVILRKCRHDLVWINTCPAPVVAKTIKNLQLSLHRNLLLRFADLLFSKKHRLKCLEPDLIWVYNSRLAEAVVAARLLTQHPKAKLVIELEDLPAARQENASWRGWLDWQATRWLLRRASFTTCVSRSAAQALQRRIKISDDALILLPPLLDDSYLSILRERRLPPCSRRKIRVMYAGGYSREKGIDDLLSAFVQLPWGEYSLHLLGPATPSVYRIAKSHPHIFVHGVVDKSWLYRCYVNADVVVNPHRAILATDHISPFKQIEQMASGAIPLVSSHIAVDAIELPVMCRFEGSNELLERLLMCREIASHAGKEVHSLAVSIRHVYSIYAAVGQVERLLAA